MNQNLGHLSNMRSPLEEASLISPRKGSRAAMAAAAVTLTSLVDAFSILVVYLLVSFSNSGEIIYLSKDMMLPSAGQSDPLERATMVKLDGGKIYLEEKEVTPEGLLEGLVDLRKEFAAKNQGGGQYAVTVQADKKLEYSELNQVVLASSHAGFSEVKFAVLAK